MVLAPLLSLPFTPGMLALFVFTPCTFPPSVPCTPIIVGEGRNRRGGHGQGGKRSKGESTNTHSVLLFRLSGDYRHNGCPARKCRKSGSLEAFSFPFRCPGSVT
jgi:hypothetical protein